jgi:hypothetical protein
MPSVYEIVRDIMQVVSDARDGSHVAKYRTDGLEKKIGLKREIGDPLLDSRVIDGFGVKISGKTLMLSYQCPYNVRYINEVGVNKFNEEIEDMIQNIIKYVKKEYKGISKGSLTLSQIGEIDIDIERNSPVNTNIMVTAFANYTIGGMDEVEDARQPSDPKLRDDIKRFSELSGIGKQEK